MWWERIIIAKAGEIWGGETKKPLVCGVGGLLAGWGRMLGTGNHGMKIPWSGARIAAGAVSGI